ncbi:RecB family exonuclease [Nocardioides dongxiaopingii]|uniref:RecB family exonuclease n=1 Tax=Nocardioides dongxiaopingii TaxID=2576036 RepID=UPI0010C76C16|nr:PD-(D/E)XK nuclease family protein [Nocardioides dongxiaopingii]
MGITAIGTGVADDADGGSPAERLSTRVDGVEVLGALSPSRAADFLTCPLLYRFRTVDRLPEPPSVDAMRGTVVHQVLEDIFDLPAAERTPERAQAMVAPVWEQILLDHPEAALMFADPDGAPGAAPDAAQWLVSCRDSVRRWYDLEDPRRLEPAERELYVEALLESKLLLRGFIDRVDEAPDGALRLNDYKTGKAPREGFEGRPLFQLRFYALALWRSRGVVPRVLQLVYLGSGEVITYEPDEHDLLATERKVEAVWRAITHAQRTGDWQPSRGPLCGWCAHQALCPAWGGTPPPLPEPSATTPAQPGAGASGLEPSG